jgi:hypothetical protein
MSGKLNPRTSKDGRSFVLAIVVFLAMLLLFLRMVVFVAGHGPHHF